MNVFDGLKVPSRGLVFNDSSWQFAYQAIGGLRYDINPVLILDLDYPLSGDDRIDIRDSQYGPPLPHGRQHEQFRGEPDLSVRPAAADRCPVDPRAAATLGAPTTRPVARPVTGGRRATPSCLSAIQQRRPLIRAVAEFP